MGINRHKYIIFFVIFLFSINIKSFGVVSKIQTDGYEDNGGGVYIGVGAKKGRQLPKLVDGVYQINNKAELYGFADIVNGYTNKFNQGATKTEEEAIGPTPGAKAILTQDIEVISPTDNNAYTGLQKLLKGEEITDGEKTDLKKLEWTPIGKKFSEVYTGEFYGNGKTISSLYCNIEDNDNRNAYSGLFGCVSSGAKIKNLRIKNSYFKGNSENKDSYVGGLISVCVENASVSECCVLECEIIGTGNMSKVGGLIGFCGIETSNSDVTIYNCYSDKCEVSSTVTGENSENSENSAGGLIGNCGISNEQGNINVSGCYAIRCEVSKKSGYGYTSGAGGLIGSLAKSVIGGRIVVDSCYSADCSVKEIGTGTENGNGNVAGGLIGGCCNITIVNSYSIGCIVESSRHAGGLIGECIYGTVTNSYSSNTEITATGANSYKGGICGNLNSGTIKDCYYLKTSDLKGTGNKEDGETRNDVKPFGAELKIPVRVKINYDPSNKLETLVSKNFKHEFFRQKTGNTSWEEMLQNIHYVYNVSPVESSIKINPDGSKTQDFIFNYYIYHAQDENNNIYKFGFNKKYPVDTYLKQDVGGGKKLYIDYGVWGRE